MKLKLTPLSSTSWGCNDSTTDRRCLLVRGKQLSPTDDYMVVGIIRHGTVALIEPVPDDVYCVYQKGFFVTSSGGIASHVAKEEFPDWNSPEDFYSLREGEEVITIRAWRLRPYLKVRHTESAIAWTAQGRVQNEMTMDYAALQGHVYVIKQTRDVVGVDSLSLLSFKENQE